MPVKVILSAACLMTKQIVRASKGIAWLLGLRSSRQAPASATGGATVHDVALMKQTVGDTCRVKALAASTIRLTLRQWLRLAQIAWAAPAESLSSPSSSLNWSLLDR